MAQRLTELAHRGGASNDHDRLLMIFTATSILPRRDTLCTFARLLVVKSQGSRSDCYGNGSCLVEVNIGRDLCGYLSWNDRVMLESRVAILGVASVETAKNAGLYYIRRVRE